jgi:hypothetical protein
MMRRLELESIACACIRLSFDRCSQSRRHSGSPCMPPPSHLLRAYRLGCAFTTLVLSAIACASEPPPASSSTGSDSGTPVTGSTTRDASTSSSASSTTTSSSTSSGSSTTTDPSTTDSTGGTTNPDPSSDDFPTPDIGGGRPSCHPLQQDCSEGEGCYPIGGDWQCVPDASGDAGEYGDPCDSEDGCDPGLVCLGTETVPPGLPCEGAAGCCTVLCDFSDPAASLDCPSAADGQLCLPWYEEGQAPPGFEDVGACSLWP